MSRGSNAVALIERTLPLALRQMHESRTRDEVLETLGEILVDFVGAEKFAIFARSEDTTSFRLLSFMGDEAKAYRILDAADDPLGARLARGEVILPSAEEGRGGYVIALPMKLYGGVTGAIVIFAVLDETSELDLETLDMLAIHAAIALETTTQVAR
jgi:hypothetical protein